MGNGLIVVMVIPHDPMLCEMNDKGNA